jgi:hypothetical protein
MLLSEMQDMVRRKLGIPDMDPFELQTILAWARYELESRGNFYFGVGLKDHTLTSSNQSYSLTSGTGTGMGITNYKEHRALFIRDVSGATWLPVPIGSWDMALPEYSHTVTGKPEVAVVENETIYFFPTPSAAYPVRLLHFTWTTNPADVTTTDELLTRWSQALFYAAMMVGKNYLTQNPQAGAVWEDMLASQVKVLKDFTNRRLQSVINTMNSSEAAQVLQASGGQQ